MLTTSLDHLHVLVIEDDPDLLRLVEMRLGEDLVDRAVVIDRAPTLVDAFAKLRSFPPVDVILLDLGLPDSPVDPDRLGALRALLSLGDIPPIIVMTANITDRAEKATAVGAADYLHKVQLVSGPALAEAVRRAVPANVNLT